MNVKGRIDAVFLDFYKAFDVVPHTKLKAVGIERNTVSWMACYLNSREQCVVNGCVFDTLDVYSEVPVGYVLGPLLFLVDLNSIYFAMQPPVKIRLVANDCGVYASINKDGDQIRLTDALHSICAWCDKCNS